MSSRGGAMRGWMEPCLVLSLRIRFDICHPVCSEMYSVHAQCLAGKVGAAKNNKCVLFCWVGCGVFVGCLEESEVVHTTVLYSVCTMRASEYGVQHMCPIEILSSLVFGLGRSPYVQLIDLDNSAVRSILSTLYEYLRGRSKRPADK